MGQELLTKLRIHLLDRDKGGGEPFSKCILNVLVVFLGPAKGSRVDIAVVTNKLRAGSLKPNLGMILSVIWLESVIIPRNWVKLGRVSQFP